MTSSKGKTAGPDHGLVTKTTAPIKAETQISVARRPANSRSELQGRDAVRLRIASAERIGPKRAEEQLRKEPGKRKSERQGQHTQRQETEPAILPLNERIATRTFKSWMCPRRARPDI